MMTEDQHDLVDFINQEIDKWDDERRYVRVLEIALAALTQPASPALKLPDGWKLVPVEPTEDMLVNGFESKPDERFSEPKVWAEYDAMSGCQQAAHRALLCWQAMLLAAPCAPHTAPIEPICATGGAEWVKVPREPTRQMMSQGHFAMAGTDRGKFRRIYLAMIAAAPQTE